MEKEERAEVILREYKNRGIEVKYSLLFIDKNTNEESYRCEFFTEDQIDKFMASFKPEELRNITIIGMPNLRFSDASLNGINHKVFHQGVSTNPKGTGNK